MTASSEALSSTAILHRAWEMAVQEILGQERTHLPAASAGDATPPWAASLHDLRAYYGETAGLGVGLRIGRAFARHLLPEVAEEAGFQEASFRFLPWPRKMQTGLERLAALAAEWFDLTVTVRFDAHGVHWEAPRCPFAPPDAAYQCTPCMGFLQEALYWLSGGHLFAVQAAGAHTLYIPLSPLH